MVIEEDFKNSQILFILAFRNFFPIFSSKNILDIFSLNDLNVTSLRFEVTIFEKNTLASLWSWAETRVNILIRGGVRAWTFPGPWRVQRERVSRSVMFVTLISCCFLTSLAALAYIVEHFLFKDEHRVAAHHYFICVSYVFCYTRNYFNSQEDSYLFQNARGIKRKYYFQLFVRREWIEVRENL